jgi:hypothetical protein
MVEVNRFVKIINKTGSVHCIGDKSTEVFDLLFTNKEVNAYQFERPDIIITRNDRNVLLEQFQFDGTEAIKKSSSQKREQAESEREFKRNMVEGEPNEVKIQEHRYKSISSVKDYELNLNRVFDNHISKYDDYIKNYNDSKELLISENVYNSIFDFGFIIEDTTLLPNIMATKNHDKYLLTPFHFESFKKKLNKYPNLKHIFFITWDGSSKNIIYYYYNHNIQDLSEFVIESSDRHLNFSPIQISATIKIPDNE